MGDFKKIETQEEFDNAIKERLEREREKERAKFSDYDELKKNNADYEKQLSSVKTQLQQFTEEKSTFETQIAELNSKVKSYETDSAKTRIALEKGLPFEMASRLTGETAEEIEADAEVIKNMLNITKKTPPVKNPEQGESTSIDKAYKSLL